MKDIKTLKKIQIQARVIMNNNTLSIFNSTNSYNSNVMSFELQETSFNPSKKKNCFILTQGNPKTTVKQCELCPFGVENAAKEFQRWLYDFNLFKYQCHFHRATINESMHILEDRLRKKIDDAKVDIVQEKSRLIKHKFENQERNLIKLEVSKTNKLAMQAIQKEIDLEERIKKEEEEKYKIEHDEMQEEIDEEKRKEECLLKAIRERELEDQYNVKLINAKKDIEKIKEGVKQSILVRRNYLKTFIGKMKKRAERMRNKQRQQLQTVRYQIASDMNNLYHSGDMEKCRVAIQSQLNRDTYCGIHFTEDIVKFTECKTEEEDFCYLCCETEFGDLHVDRRHECYDKLCTRRKHEDKDKNFVLGERSNGRWVWAGEVRKVNH